jgi:HPt (histidine-containing phosphotransfer) domain-containing protein
MISSKHPVELFHLDSYTGGNRALNEEVVIRFESQCREMLAKLESEPGNAKTWREVAHTLKGAARGIGAFGFADAAAAAERLHPSDQRGQARAAAAALENHLSHVRRFIANYPG